MNNVIYYQSGLNSTLNLDFTSSKYKMLTETSLFNYKWNYRTKGESNSTIYEFENNFKEIQVSLVIEGSTFDEYYKALNKLVTITDADRNALVPGKLYVGNCYLDCYVVASEKPNKYINTKKTIVKLTIISDIGEWIEEDKKEFSAGAVISSDENAINYPHNYPYNYLSRLINAVLENTGYVESDFEMIIQGACINPEINIADHIYAVNIELYTGERLIINSKFKKIYKVAIDGTKVNVFNDRERTSYIFQKIPIGNSTVSWSGNFSFEINLIKKRSEPEWN